MYDKINTWAFYLGRSIIENVENKDEGEGLVRRLLFDIRGEETAGRFLSKLSNRLADYKINMRLNIDTNLPPILYERTWMADSFYYMK
ncbi:MAG: hypothetical protein GXO66_04995, partial [Euryarchaeota archaeon]|nr:hypothetical protein [Euryarchaeota archaeon]